MAMPLDGSFNLIVILVLLSLAPFVAMMVTSYVKIVIVLSLIRNALGIQQIPPNIVMNGLAMILSFYIMYPVAQDTFDRVKGIDFKQADVASLLKAADNAKEPLRLFLKKHSSPRERVFFLKTAQKMWPPERAAGLKDDDLMVLVPAFTVSELTAAFQIGFLIFLPFIVVDIVVSNVLLALGMMMVSPMTISLPLKLLLFVVADGWTRLIHGLVLSYA
jgi:type III secretion protein R